VPKTAIHVFHDDSASITTATRVAQRIQETAPALGCSVGVFCSGPARRRLTVLAKSEADETFNRQIDELIADGLVVARASTRPVWMEPKVSSCGGASTCRWPGTGFSAVRSNKPV
jgi:hypothetical protein